MPTRFACVGIGGYAGVVCEQLLTAGVLRVVCEPDISRNPELCAKLAVQGIPIFSSYDELLTKDFDAVWLPLPIDLHRSFTEKALAAGKAVMCEKPAAGCIDDVDAMIAARDRYRLPVAIGFQHIFEPGMHEAKRAIAGGEIGRVISATLHGCWPRDDHYYHRNDWAGKLRRNGVWILDSPANNAMAHYINLSLFLLGKTAEQSATPQSLEAELYRANDIENYDTCSLRVNLAGGVQLLVLLTHACKEMIQPHLVITGERGSVEFINGKGLEIITAAGRRLLPADPAIYQRMIESFDNLMAGREPIVATLEVARAHALVVSGASDATRVNSIEEKFIRTTNGLRHVPGIDQAFARCAAANQMLSESGMAPWAKSAGRVELRDYKHFRGSDQK